MAGIKITDLGTLTSAVDADLLYIVDVSDTSQSPQGTSKQIELGNMFSSGSYTPTISAETNNIVVDVTRGQYIKVGNFVNCSVLLEITMDTLETTGSFEMSLPFASNLTDQKNCYGLMQWSNAGTLSEIVGLSIGSNAVTNTCEVSLETATQGISMAYCTIQFQYEVL